MMNDKQENTLKRYLLVILLAGVLPVYITLVIAFGESEIAALGSKAGGAGGASFRSGIARYLNIRSSDFYYNWAINNVGDQVIAQQAGITTMAPNDRRAYLFARASEVNPLDYLSRYELADELWKQSYSKEVVLKLMQDASSIYPLKDTLLLGLALFYSSSNDMKQGLSYFRKAAEINNDNLPFIYSKLQFINSAYLNEVTPRNYASLTHLARYHVERKEYRQAGDAYAGAFSFADPGNKLEIIKDVMSISEYERAAKLIGLVSGQMNDEPDYHWLKARYYMHKGDNTKFLHEIENAMKFASSRYMPDSPEMKDFLVTISYTFLNNNMTNTAKIYFNKILHTDLYNTEATLGISQCYYQEGDLHSAFYYASKAGDSPVLYQYMLALFKIALAKNNQVVINEILVYLKDKKTAEAWGYFARVLYLSKQGEYAEAIPNIKNAINLEPDNDAFLREAGAIYALLSDYPTAVSYYEKILALYPRDEAAASELYKIFMKQGDVDGARALCGRMQGNGVALSECKVLLPQDPD